jgi:hypothetical protein
VAKRTNILDELLPLLRPRRAELHNHAAVLEVADRAQLLELAANPRLRRYLLGRLSDTAALVDPASVNALEKALLAEGHMPKMARGASQ